MNILHLTTGHSAFDDRIFYKEATSLANKHNILVLAYSATGVLKTMGNEQRAPGRYDSIAVDCFGKCSFVVRVLRRLGFLEFPLREILGVLERYAFRPAVIHCHEMPSLRLAIKLRKYLGSKVVFDVHEFFLGYCFDKYGNGVLSDLSFSRLRRSYKELLQHVDVTISVNEFIRAINVVFNPKARHLMVPNAFVLQSPIAVKKTTDKYVLVHEGTLNFGRGLEDLMAIFEDEWIRDNCILKIVGELRGRESKYFQAILERKPYLHECVSITGWIDYEKLYLHLTGDVGLITMKPSVNNMLAGAPNKLYNYIWAGMPICTYDIPASSYLVKRYDLGLVSPRTRGDLNFCIRKICADIDRYRGNVAACRDDFGFRHFVGELESAYV